MVNLCRVAMATAAAAAKRAVPASVRGMTSFDEGRFETSVTVPYATVKRHMVGAFRKFFGHYVLKVGKVKMKAVMSKNWIRKRKNAKRTIQQFYISDAQLQSGSV